MSYCAIHVIMNMSTGRHIIMTYQQLIRLMPPKIWLTLQAVIKLAVAFHVAYHVNQIMTDDNHITRH